MKFTFQTTFEDLNEETYDVEVTGTFIRGRMGTRTGFDRFPEPDEPDEFEIESITEVGTGREFDEDDNPNEFLRIVDQGIEQGSEKFYEGLEEPEYEF